MHSPATTPNTQQTASAPSSGRLQAVYARYKGTPYRYGGTDSSGFDCSGFIGVAYRDAFDLALPRTTEQLAANGKPIRRDQLKEGDIIIFKTSVKQLHAGIYTGAGKFIHASTSKGVIESSLDNQYWHQRYIKARRYL
jgi:cell wall-associated NlpC family hydrolase